MHSHEFQGKNIFTKLGDVIDLKKKETIKDTNLISNRSNNKLVTNLGTINKDKKEDENLKKKKGNN